LSVELAQQLLQRRFPRFIGRRHSAKKVRRLPYRARSPGSIDFPPPWIRGRSPVLHDDGIITVIETGIPLHRSSLTNIYSAATRSFRPSSFRISSRSSSVVITRPKNISIVLREAWCIPSSNEALQSL